MYVCMYVYVLGMKRRNLLCCLRTRTSGSSLLFRLLVSLSVCPSTAAPFPRALACLSLVPFVCRSARCLVRSFVRSSARATERATDRLHPLPVARLVHFSIRDQPRIHRDEQATERASERHEPNETRLEFENLLVTTIPNFCLVSFLSLAAPHTSSSFLRGGNSFSCLFCSALSLSFSLSLSVNSLSLSRSICLSLYNSKPSHLIRSLSNIRFRRV